MKELTQHTWLYLRQVEQATDESSPFLLWPGKLRAAESTVYKNIYLISSRMKQIQRKFIKKSCDEMISMKCAC